MLSKSIGCGILLLHEQSLPPIYEYFTPPIKPENVGPMTYKHKKCTNSPKPTPFVRKYASLTERFGFLSYKGMWGSIVFSSFPLFLFSSLLFPPNFYIYFFFPLSSYRKEKKKKKSSLLNTHV